MNIPQTFTMSDLQKKNPVTPIPTLYSRVARLLADGSILKSEESSDGKIIYKINQNYRNVKKEHPISCFRKIGNFCIYCVAVIILSTIGYLIADGYGKLFDHGIHAVNEYRYDSKVKESEIAEVVASKRYEVGDIYGAISARAIAVQKQIEAEKIKNEN